MEGFRLRSTETVRRSSALGLIGSSLSRSSDCCLLNVPGRGNPGTTFLESLRAMLGRVVSSWSGAGGGAVLHVLSSLPSFPKSLFQDQVVLWSVDAALS